MTKKGKLFGVGVGPGDPGLLTMKAVDTIRRAPIVAVPYTSSQEDSLALKIVSMYLKHQTEIVFLHFPMVRDEIQRQQYRRSAAEQIAEFLNQGKDVAFLTEGDPSIYSTFTYLLKLLAGDFIVEIIPGISSVMASAAEAQQPLTIGDQRLAVLPATFENMDDLGDILDSFDTVVLMKVNSVIEEVTAALKQKGLLDSAILVERASINQCRVITEFQQIKNGQIHYLSQLIITE